jgi:three-Cys-motif partner protein
MAKSFHQKQFDDGTHDKLTIFRGYVRRWIPVFLTAWKNASNYEAVNVFDFFAGPGTDAAGNPGSPRIIQDELKAYCGTHNDLKAEGLQIRLYFNDKDKSHIQQLERCLAANACPKACCTRVFSSKPFQQAFADRLPLMQQHRSANLVIMDQFGMKEVTPALVTTLAGCRATDILFFVSSSCIRRFAAEPATQSYFQMSTDDLVSLDYKSIHRHICAYFRSTLPNGVKYHLAPFSIKKGGNIYGIVFGSGSLLGLQKFLEACWELDEVTGEANYDIDDDPARYGDRFLFAEMNGIKKQDAFERDLEDMLRESGNGRNKSSPANNLDVYRFTLETGFLPKHASKHLAELRKAGRLEVQTPQSAESPKKGAFYLSWEYYKQGSVKALFRLKD